MNNFKIINLGDPTKSRDGATKYYVDHRFHNSREMINRNRGDS